MAKKTSSPSIKKAAFDCPHCGAFTTQYWFSIYAKELEDSRPLPILSYCTKIASGLIFLDEKSDSTNGQYANNLLISKCYNCEEIAVWVHDNIVFPHAKQGTQPNQDLPEDIIRDFEEARTIVGLSPRGAAALLRLCVQKLCAFLGEKGKNIDDDIASLVKKGLNPLIQQSLDIVRVIGNEAVHPGVIDLNDDRDTANKLFNLINSIADQMITHPNSVEELYNKLPEAKRKAIEKRDKN
jgi:hypothetical protein